MEHLMASMEDQKAAMERRKAVTEHRKAAMEHRKAAMEHPKAATEHLRAPAESTVVAKTNRVPSAFHHGVLAAQIIVPADRPAQAIIPPPGRRHQA